MAGIIKFNNVEVFGSDGKVTTAGMPTGSILQVKSSNKNTLQGMTGTGALNWQDISDLSIAITPATGSDIFIIANVFAGAISNNSEIFRIVRDGTAIGVGTGQQDRSACGWGYWTSHSNAQVSTSFSYLDTSPGGDGSTAITYKVQISIEGSTGSAVYINATQGDANYYYTPRGHSSITVMEIKA